MNALDLARWQFGITTIHHFLFMPLSIGLSLLIAIMQTAWFRTGSPKYLAMTRFWGKLFLINFAVGTVSGIVPEFQFGMNRSAHSRFVGDVFGGPLAMEAIVAFFLEATFIGLWIFGWDRLPRAAHLGCIWLVAIGTNKSAYFILAANSWMQHPVGGRVSELERWRTGPACLSGPQVVRRCTGSPRSPGRGCRGWSWTPRRLAELARYGMGADVAQLKRHGDARRMATLVATAAQLKATATDDALELLELLMATELIGTARQEANAEGAPVLAAMKALLRRGEERRDGLLHDHLAHERAGVQTRHVHRQWVALVHAHGRGVDHDLPVGRVKGLGRRGLTS
jgi:hypothetical protein